MWNSFVPAFTATGTVARFTPDTAILVTRIQVQLGAGPSGCTVAPIVQISNGLISGTQTITLSSAATDSVALNIGYVSGTPIIVSVTRTATCAKQGIAPQNANIAVQYHAQ